MENGSNGRKIEPYDGSKGPMYCVDCGEPEELLIYSGAELLSAKDMKRLGGKAAICRPCAYARGNYFLKHGFSKPLAGESAEDAADAAAPAKDGA